MRGVGVGVEPEGKVDIAHSHPPTIGSTSTAEGRKPQIRQNDVQDENRFIYTMV